MDELTDYPSPYRMQNGTPIITWPRASGWLDTSRKRRGSKESPLESIKGPNGYLLEQEDNEVGVKLFDSLYFTGPNAFSELVLWARSKEMWAARLEKRKAGMPGAAFEVCGIRQAPGVGKVRVLRFTHRAKVRARQQWEGRYPNGVWG